MNTLIFYCISFIILLICEIVYFRIARRFHIGDNVTSRSSHKTFCLTGGGIIYIISAIIYYIHYQSALPIHYGAMLIGALALAAISFADDINNISPYVRLIVQTIVVSLVFSYILECGYIDIYILVLVCGVGLINAYNFMDGINGIMAGYTLVTLGTLLYCYATMTNTPESTFAFIILLILASLIFAFFNFRKKAVCFSGDVGSIVIGFFILFLSVELIFARNDATSIVFLAVYGIDTVYTIFQRLFMGENIFLSHRHHLYQVFTNQWQITHYKVSAGYALTQLAINIIYFIVPEAYKWSYVIIIVILLSVFYFIAKRSPRSRNK